MWISLELLKLQNPASINSHNIKIAQFSVFFYYQQKNKVFYSVNLEINLQKLIKQCHGLWTKLNVIRI